MKKLTLLYPPYHFHPPQWPFSRPTLVLAHLYAVLNQSGLYDVNAIDLDLEYTTNHQSIDFFLSHAVNQVTQNHPDIVCISCKAAQYPFATLFTRRYKQQYPDTKIIIGGWMPTLAPTTVLKMTPCDAVIRGEGERSLLELLSVIDDNHPKVNSVSYVDRQRNQIVHNPNAQRLSQSELDNLPLPDYTILPDLHHYQPANVKTRIWNNLRV